MIIPVQDVDLYRLYAKVFGFPLCWYSWVLFIPFKILRLVNAQAFITTISQSQRRMAELSRVFLFFIFSFSRSCGSFNSFPQLLWISSFKMYWKHSSRFHYDYFPSPKRRLAGCWRVLSSVEGYEPVKTHLTNSHVDAFTRPSIKVIRISHHGFYR